jgi:hypothetical protein
VVIVGRRTVGVCRVEEAGVRLTGDGGPARRELLNVVADGAGEGIALAGLAARGELGRDERTDGVRDCPILDVRTCAGLDKDCLR